MPTGRSPSGVPVTSHSRSPASRRAAKPSPLPFRGEGSAAKPDSGRVHQRRLWKPIRGMTYWVQSVRRTRMMIIWVIPNLNDSPVEYMFER